MNRRQFLKTSSVLTSGLMLPFSLAEAKTYLTIEQAKTLIWGDLAMAPLTITLTKQQMKAIQASSKTRVRHPEITAWKSEDHQWLVADQVIGKHENIDIAVGISHKGGIKGLEILTYRETYGYEVAHPKWRSQFHGRDHTAVLRLDKEIKNISGATLSCNHLTAGINRLTQTWAQVLKLYV